MHDFSRWLLSPFLVAACTPWAPPGELTTAVDPTTGPVTTAAPSGWELPDHDRGDPRPPTTAPPTTADPTTLDAGTTSGDGSGTTGAPLPAVDLAALQIVEVHPDPDGKDGGPDSPEFLEILNIGAAPVSLAGLEIVARAWPVLDAAGLGIADATLDPGQRLLVVRHAAAADLPDPTISSDDTGLRVAFATDEGLRNSDGGVLLRAGEHSGDLVIYGAPQPAPWDDPEAWTGSPAASPGPGMSLCRLGGDHDDATDFAECPASPGAPGEVDGTTGDTGDTGDTAAPEPAEVVIVEVLSNPPGPGMLEKQAEFVELINLGPGAVDLAGWTIADDLADDAAGIDPLLHLAGDGGCAPSTCLAPGQRAVIVSGSYLGPLGPGLALVTDDTTLANAGLGVHEPVAVRDAEGVLRSTYRAWPDPLSAPDPATEETSLVRGDPTSPDTPAAWAFAPPTPGT